MSSEKNATTLWLSEGQQGSKGLTPVAPSAGLTSMTLGCLVSTTEIWLEVVDWRFLKARGVPSQQDDTTSRRANAGGKETPRYAKTTPRRAAPRRTRPRSRRDRPSWSEEDAR